MGLTGMRMLDNAGNPYSNANPMPIVASITSNLTIATQTSAPIEVSATKATNTAANPIFVSVAGMSGATGATITAYNITATVQTIAAATGRITLTLQNSDTITTIFIGNTNTVSATTTGANIELYPKTLLEEEDWAGVLYAIAPAGTSALLKAYEVVA